MARRVYKVKVPFEELLDVGKENFPTWLMAKAEVDFPIERFRYLVTFVNHAEKVSIELWESTK
jgi:hypothetical protein